MRIAHALLALLLSALLNAQFYPDSNATWCLVDQDTWDVRDVNMVMDGDPDTMILGQVYKRIREYRGLNGEVSFVLWDRHYVRSAEDGKGYVFLLDSVAEYVTGDTAAQAGDTIQNVLAWNQLSECHQQGQTQNLALYTVVVDSVVLLTYEGVTVRRHFVHTPCYLASPSFESYRFFWQAGMGSSAGPYMQLRSGFVPIEMSCAMAGDLAVFGLEMDQVNGHIGLPGGVQCCWPVTVPDALDEKNPEGAIIATPNPSTGIFKINAEKDVNCEVSDMMGRRVMYVEGNSIDLSAEPEGMYVAKASRGDLRSVLRLVVRR